MALGRITSTECPRDFPDWRSRSLRSPWWWIVVPRPGRLPVDGGQGGVTILPTGPDHWSAGADALPRSLLFFSPYRLSRLLPELVLQRVVSQCPTSASGPSPQINKSCAG